MKRLGIYVLYDKEGIVDTYIEYFLAKFQKYLSKLVIVCNGKLSEKGEKRLKKFTDEIFIRENTGYDAMAYKEAMSTYLGWNEIQLYDELLLVNDTFYGPLYPLSELFERMDKKNCDFWGLTCQNEYIDHYSDSHQKSPAYIQSYFMGFRKQVFQSALFQDYWNQFDSTKWIFSDVLNKHEKIFTYMLQQWGFSWDTYLSAPEFESKNPKDNFIQYFYIAYQLIKDYRCPIIKRKNFITKRLVNNPGELGNDTEKAFLWIKENTDYDTDMIWENLLRLYKMEDIQKSLNLKLLISNHPSAAPVQKNNIATLVIRSGSISEQQKSYIHLLREHIKIFDTKDLDGQKDNENVLTNITQQIAENDAHGYILLLISIENPKSADTALRKYSIIEEQWGNLVGNHAYISTIVQRFCENKRLGILLAPCGIHGMDFGRTEEQKLQGYIGLYCRKKIFLEMMDQLIVLGQQNDKMTITELRNKFVKTAQQMGYYTATVMRASYASMACTNMEEMLAQIQKHTKSRYEFDDFEEYLDGDMLLFCEKYSRIYVYGAGENGGRAARLIVSEGHGFIGYVVSDDQLLMEKKDGYPVYKLSMLEQSEKAAGIVISVANRKAQVEIMDHLQKKGFKNIYLLDT